MAFNPLPERIVPLDDCHQADLMEIKAKDSLYPIPEFLKKTELSCDEQVRAFALIAMSNLAVSKYRGESNLREKVNEFEVFIKTGLWAK